MKVYIIEWNTAEQYEDWSGPHMAFSTEQKAQAYIDSHQGEYDDCGDGYFIGQCITELTVQ